MAFVVSTPLAAGLYYNGVRCKRSRGRYGNKGLLTLLWDDKDLEDDKCYIERAADQPCGPIHGNIESKTDSIEI